MTLQGVWDIILVIMRAPIVYTENFLFNTAACLRRNHGIGLQSYGNYILTTPEDVF